MSDFDLTHLLQSWPLQPGCVNARRIIGADEKPKIQVRIELGVIQLEEDGRPDGLRPGNYETEFALQRHRMQQYQTQSGTSAGFVLSSEECKTLRDEVMQFYHRYVALFAMGEFEKVVRDATHILDIDELCRDSSASPEDREALRPFRTSAVSMRARAQAEYAVVAGQSKEALLALDRGLDELRLVYQEFGQPEVFDSSNEVTLLRGMRAVLVPKLPSSQRVELQQRIQAAIDAENYELAAILRDELKMMKQ